MKIPPRILLPVAAAVILAAGLLSLLWWQLRLSTQHLEQEFKRALTLPDGEGSIAITVTPIDASDRALLHLRQGDLFAVRGEWAAAQGEYEKSVQVGGGVTALRKLAQAQLQRRDLSAVRSTIQKLRQEGVRVEDLLLLESIVQLRTGELVKAQAVLENASDSPQKHYGLALLAIIQGSHDRAKEELQGVLAGWDPVLRANARTLLAAYEEFALFPESSELHLITLLSRALAQVQECELALPLLNAVTRQQDDYRDAWIVQGYCELVTERFTESLASLERAYSLDPEKPEIQYFLARAHAALGDHRNAITFLQYALTNGFTPEKEARRIIAREAGELGDSELELEQYRVVNDSPGADIQSFEKFITLAITLGKKEEAYVSALKASVAFPKDAKAFELLGWAAQESGRPAEARSALEKALALDPTLESAHDRLEKL